MKLVYPLIWFLCFLFAAGCFTLSPNVRTWNKGNVEAFGSLDSKGHASYYQIRIGTEEFPYGGGAAFVIRLNRKIVLRSSDFSEPTIRKKALSMGKPSGRRVLTYCSDGTRIYSFGGASFVYREDHLIALDIGIVTLPDEIITPEIAEKGEDSFSSFPISEDLLQRIFGSPDKTRDALVW
jgi:hypothetical protein